LYGIGVIQAIITQNIHHFSIKTCQALKDFFQKILIKIGSHKNFHKAYQVALQNIVQKKSAIKISSKSKKLADAIIRGSTGIGCIKASV